MTIQEPMGYWDWIVIPRVNFENFRLDYCLDFAKEKCNKEFKPQGAKDVIFEYHLTTKKAHELVTLELNNVTLPDLLKKICLPHGIAIEEQQGKLIFTEKKVSSPER